MLLESRFANIQYYGAGVFDWFAGKLGPLGRYIPSGRRISGLLGNSKMAPWILCKTISQENTNLIDSREIADLLQCPCCGGNIFGNNRRYICAICGTRFPVEDGIIDMRV
jgi:DNA-directed RNA polymerase subunit RPC12/RpoP